jgi:hypothetical protein
MQSLSSPHMMAATDMHATRADGSDVFSAVRAEANEGQLQKEQFLIICYKCDTHT